MRSLSVKEREVAVIRTPLIVEVEDFEGAGKGVGFTVGLDVAMVFSDDEIG